MQRPALTKRAADAAQYEGDGRRPFILWDGKVAGFGLRIHPTGRKTFVARYRNAARQHGVTDVLVRPERVEKLALRHHAIAIRNEQGQQVEDLGLDPKLLARPGQPECVDV